MFTIMSAAFFRCLCHAGCLCTSAGLLHLCSLLIWPDMIKHAHTDFVFREQLTSCGQACQLQTSTCCLPVLWICVLDMLILLLLHAWLCKVRIVLLSSIYSCSGFSLLFSALYGAQAEQHCREEEEDHHHYHDNVWGHNNSHNSGGSADDSSNDGSSGSCSST